MKRRAALSLIRRTGLVGIAALGLGGCGFKLRGNQNFAFTSLAVMPMPGGPIAMELRRSMDAAVRVLAPDAPQAQAQVVIDILQELREKTVVGVNSSGQVREFQLRIRLKFRVRTPQGQELTPDSEILQQRDISFNETAVLAKEAEEVMLYRDMQTDIVQQLMRRLATVKLNNATSP
jgi:LPS-assembly lipoprotein